MPQINGSGNLTITDVASGVDLSSLSVDNALNVTLEVTESREITDLDSSWIDNLDLAADTVVTMTVKQYNDIERSGEGSYALADTAEELATVTDSIMGIDITVTDAVSLAQLQALDTANGADGLTYFTVSDTSEELVANANGEDDVTYILNDVDVVVTDNITITELGDVKTAIGGGTVTAQTIEGSIAELMPEEVVIPYVGEGTNVTVTGSVTIDQIKAIDEQNGDGELTYVLTDSYSEIADDLADDFKALVFGRDTPGYASVMSAVLFFGGMQLLSIGVLGEYMARLFVEVKQRPLYLVEVDSLGSKAGSVQRSKILEESGQSIDAADDPDHGERER